MTKGKLVAELVGSAGLALVLIGAVMKAKGHASSRQVVLITGPGAFLAVISAYLTWRVRKNGKAKKSVQSESSSSLPKSALKT
jgi:membrane protein implicated in regulation of membrane protease activity